MRKEFLIGLILVLAGSIAITYASPMLSGIWLVVGPLTFMGLHDFLQKKSAVKRNFPLLGRFRYFFEMVRPEIQQYFIESNSEGSPFPREVRSVIYQRAKRVIETVPFGTQKNVYQVGYEWVNHSLLPSEVHPESLKTIIGGKDCSQKYNSSILNISAMSYGSLSKNAIESLNLGASLGGFSHNTGEGGISPYHKKGGDLVWQIGTGYFGTRNEKGLFCPDAFEKTSRLPEVKMIEIKLSQGAKPGHGGILPGKKVNEEISEIRGVPLGKDVISPPAHSAFSTPVELIKFVQKLRELSGGKPIGIKMCVGKPREFYAICKAMIELGTTPDFITVDGSEGGTGAAPLEFSNYIGTPLTDSIVLVHNALVGFGFRSEIKIIAAGKITTGFDIVRVLALGADVCNSARGMMMSLGCIQALKCNTNHCPVGVATQDEGLRKGLVVSDKKHRVDNYHHQTLESVSEIISAMGVPSHSELKPWHIMRRAVNGKILHLGRVYEFLDGGELISNEIPGAYSHAIQSAESGSFRYQE